MSTNFIDYYNEGYVEGDTYHMPKMYIDFNYDSTAYYKVSNFRTTENPVTYDLQSTDAATRHRI